MKFLLALLLLTGSAVAQPQLPQSPEVQALQSKLMQEISAGLQCTTQAITLQQENAQLKTVIETLKKSKESVK